MQISNRDTPCDAPLMSDAPPPSSILSTKCAGAHEISGIKASIFSVGRWGVVEWVAVGWVGVGLVKWGMVVVEWGG